MLMCDTPLIFSTFSSIYSRKLSQPCSSHLSSLVETLKVTKSLANSSFWTVMGIRIIANKHSTTCTLTCTGIPAGVQKIVVMKCSPSRKSSVHLHRMLALRCFLLSIHRFRITSIGFIHISVDQQFL